MGKSKKFISIIFKNTPKDYLVDMFVDFLKGLLGNYISYQYTDNFLTVIFDCDAKVDFEEIINGLNNDFYITTSLFESGIIYEEISIDEYISHIKSCSKSILDSNLIYVDEKILVKLNLDSEVVERNIFKSFYNDFEMLEVEPVDISSTLIRLKKEYRQSISDIIPSVVEDYIVKNGLYED